MLSTIFRSEDQFPFAEKTKWPQLTCWQPDSLLIHFMAFVQICLPLVHVTLFLGVPADQLDISMRMLCYIQSKPYSSSHKSVIDACVCVCEIKSWVLVSSDVL